MNKFIKSSLDWLLDQEEKAANNHKIHDHDIDQQIAQVTARKEKYQRQVDDSMAELDHILLRLQAIKEKNTQSGNVKTL